MLIGALDGVVRDRIRMATARPRRGQRHHRRGAAARSAAPGSQALGLPDDPKLRDGLEGALEAEIDRELARAKRAELDDDDALEELVQRTCARICNDAIGKKPVCTVMISRLEA